MNESMKRILLRLAPGLRRAIDPGGIFFLEPVDSALRKTFGEE